MHEWIPITERLPNPEPKRPVWVTYKDGTVSWRSAEITMKWPEDTPAWCEIEDGRNRPQPYVPIEIPAGWRKLEPDEVLQEGDQYKVPSGWPYIRPPKGNVTVQHPACRPYIRLIEPEKRERRCGVLGLSGPPPTTSDSAYYHTDIGLDYCETINVTEVLPDDPDFDACRELVEWLAKNHGQIFPFADSGKYDEYMELLDKCRR